jgi:hypothetical protein
MEGLFLLFVIATAVNAVVLWLAVKFVAPGCDKNTLRNAFIFVATIYGIMILPAFVIGPLWVLLGGILALFILIGGLLMNYDLGVGQMFLVLIVMASIRIFAWGFFSDLAGIPME